MASLGLSSDELKRLELIRNRFASLSENLSSLRKNAASAQQPIPSRESLQATAAILQQNIASIQQIMNKQQNARLFKRLVVHPSTNFPGRTQEQVLQHLLRRKLEPQVEDWVQEAHSAARAVGGLDVSSLEPDGRPDGSYNDEDYDDGDVSSSDEHAIPVIPSDPFNEQWADIKHVCDEGIRRYIEGQAREPYTVAEQAMGTEKVRTGLKRSLDEDEDDDEDESDEDEDDEDDESDEDEEMAGVKQPVKPVAAPVTTATRKGPVKPSMHPENVLWFVAKGNTRMPKNIELESLRKDRLSTKQKGPPMM